MGRCRGRTPTRCWRRCGPCPATPTGRPGPASPPGRRPTCWSSARSSTRPRCSGWEVLHAVDPTGVLAGELASAAGDELWLTPTPTGRVRLRGEVDQVTGALLTTLVEAGATPRPSAADGPDPRPASTRRAHALSQVLRLAANAAPSVHGGLSPHLLITMTLDTLRTVGPVPRGGAHDGGDGGGDGPEGRGTLCGP